MIKKIKEIHNNLIDGFCDSVKTVIGIVGFLLIFCASPILFLWTMGLFFTTNYLGGFEFLVLFMVIFYSGKGLEKYFTEETEKGKEREFHNSL